MRIAMVAAGVAAAALFGAAPSAEALQVLSGSGFCTGTSIPIRATVTADKDGNVKVKWSGKYFAPGEVLTCHLDCVVDVFPATPTPVPCGPADDKGKFKATLVYPGLICIGMVPRVVIDSSNTNCGLGFYD